MSFRQWIITSLLFCGSAAAEIVLGVSNVTSGPTKELGEDLNWGAELYFDEINKTGGIEGEKVTLRKLDDGYEPDRAVNNTKVLLQSDAIGLFNFVGTPTTSAIMNILLRQRKPLITPFTGADFLRIHPSKVFNIRASYEQEAYAQVDLIVKELGLRKVALFIQADEFGLALERYHLKALEQLGVEPVAVVRYQRNTEHVHKAADSLINKNVDAILYVGTFRPLVSFIEYAHQKAFNPTYITSSFVSSYRLFERLKTPVKVIVTEVVPDPNTCEVRLCRTFRKLAAQQGITDLNRVQFEGFLNAVYVAEALTRCKQKHPDVAPSCLVEQLRKGQPAHSLETKSPQINEGKIYYSEFVQP